MKHKSIFCLGLLLAMLLSACASPAPTAAPTATVTPSLTMTAAPTATATVTPTSTPTAIPATPEYAGELRYDPETRALNNPQDTPVFTLSEDGAWKGLTPEVPGEIMAGLEEEGYEDVQVEDGYGTQIITGEDKDGDGERDILGLYTEEYGWDVEGIGEDLDFFGKGDYLEKHEGKVYVINEYDVASGVWENGEWQKYIPPLDVVGKQPKLETIYDGIYEGAYQELEDEANANMEELIIKAEENRLYDQDGNKIPWGDYGEIEGKFGGNFYVSGFVGASKVFEISGMDNLAWMMIAPGKYRNQGVIFWNLYCKGDFINIKLEKEDGVFPGRIDEDGASQMLKGGVISRHNLFLMLGDNDFKGKQIIVAFKRNVASSSIHAHEQDEYDGLMEALRRGETYDDDDDDSYFILQRLIMRREDFNFYNN